MFRIKREIKILKLETAKLRERLDRLEAPVNEAREAEAQYAQGVENILAYDIKRAMRGKDDGE